MIFEPFKSSSLVLQFWKFYCKTARKMPGLGSSLNQNQACPWLLLCLYFPFWDCGLKFSVRLMLHHVFSFPFKISNHLIGHTQDHTQADKCWIITYLMLGRRWPCSLSCAPWGWPSSGWPGFEFSLWPVSCISFPPLTLFPALFTVLSSLVKSKKAWKKWVSKKEIPYPVSFFCNAVMLRLILNHTW